MINIFIFEVAVFFVVRCDWLSDSACCFSQFGVPRPDNWYKDQTAEFL